MKVVYVTIEKQIRKAIEAADYLGRMIDYIELTKFEAKQLWAELQPLNRTAYMNELSPRDEIKDGDNYYGVQLKVAK